MGATSTRSGPSRELVFCASSSYCNTARMVEKGTVFFCKQHQNELEAAAASTRIGPGTHVIAKDRRNHGVVVDVDGGTATVRFHNPVLDTDTVVQMSIAWLEVA
ncbi:MAG: hypothetical protein M0Z30_07840 [Actinomycetota bacterium]|nr:hypothetical protein [Actinomycetota bacterium]